MSKKLKSYMMHDLSRRLEGVDSGVLISTAGLNSEKTYNFRASLHKAGLRYMVLRNSLARKTFSKLGYPEEKLRAILKGSVGFVFGDEEAVALKAARTLVDWKKENKDKIVQWVGALMDGQVMNADQAKDLKDAPTRPEAYAMLAGVLQAPAAQLLGTLNEPGRQAIGALKAYHDKKNEG